MNLKKITPILLLAAAGGAFYFYIKKLKNKKELTTENNNLIDNNTSTSSTPSTSNTPSIPSTSSTPSTPKKQTINLNKVLKSGSSGLEVKLLQVYLNQYLKPLKKKQLIIDGNFGKDTLIALNWLFKRKQTSLQEIKDFSISRGLDWALMKKIAKQILAKKKVNINTESF
jgi:hypothetical protein